MGTALVVTRATDVVYAIANFLPVPGPPTIVATLMGNLASPKTLLAAFPAREVPTEEPIVLKRFESGIGLSDQISPSSIKSSNPRTSVTHLNEVLLRDHSVFRQTIFQVIVPLPKLTYLEACIRVHQLYVR
jgi:hypothetical protein